MIPRSVFTEEHNMFRDSVRKFMQREIQPHWEEWEAQGHISREAWLKAGEAGILCTHIPVEYGGSGVDFRYSAIAIEEQGYVFASGPGFSLHSDIVAPYILHYGTEEQKQKWLPKMCTGEVITAIAMTEPGTGSDLAGVRTTAIEDGDHYVINGSKTFITNGQMADLYIVVAKTDTNAGAKGVSLFLVEADRAGFSRGQNLKKVGMKAQDTSELFFDNVRIPKENLMGQKNAGFIYLMQELAQERLSVAIIGAAVARACYDATVTYVKERKAFGKPVAAFQNTRFKLAEIRTELEVTQCYVDRCLELHCEGKLSIDAAASVKLWATEAQCRIIDECVQLHGGYGYMWEYPVARAYADSRVQRIYAGTSEIMKEIISRTI
ncbi:acyl-CoA dehydrogenase family protein [Thalassolituus hydrocarboniclasticus]|uniref:Acyl-CoA dehydrogenase family protein n=1 Tax=Thalassolituus hydrocarboniclasticus TaxID=2742796 RepID=A0ABY6AEN1_9GAMM|nr:acyl-CoA dehydrogenase family protein [Thalassolituus hydrocarboniclasticus]UXD88373.1 acyl-CoA dehydrogenase family protein [Thalassolituus hydrocarboniclasticus]